MTRITEEYGDVVVVEENASRRDGAVKSSVAPHEIVGVQGRFELDGWRDTAGNARQFACKILKISPHMIKLSAPVTGAVGQWVIVYFDDLGKFEGPIVQVMSRALVMRIIGTHEDRARVASKLAWITDAEKPEARRFPRIVPTRPESTVTVPGSTAVPCEVIDYSAGGVAVYSDVEPAMGSVVKIGLLLSRVVRQFPGGFAVSFLTVRDDQSSIEASLANVANDPK